MTRTPDEIKKGLECCTCLTGLMCPFCSYAEDGGMGETCREDMAHDALAYIQQLEAERDAAIADMTEMAKYGGENCCEWCDQTECECTCAEVGIYAGFNWRGVQKEE